MGMSVSVYVGPLVRITLRPTAYIEPTRCCPTLTCAEYGRSAHGRDGRAAFCSACGTKITTVDIPRKGVRSWEDFAAQNDYKYEDVLYAPENLGDSFGEQIAISNSTCHYISPEDENVLALSDLDQEAEFKQFTEQNVDMLTEMHEFFGDNNLVIDYGVAAYWS